MGNGLSAKPPGGERNKRFPRTRTSLVGTERGGRKDKNKTREKGGGGRQKRSGLGQSRFKKQRVSRSRGERDFKDAN